MYLQNYRSFEFFNNQIINEQQYDNLYIIFNLIVYVIIIFANIIKWLDMHLFRNYEHFTTVSLPANSSIATS